VMGALARVAKEMGIRRVRRPFETLKNSWATTRRSGKPLSKQLFAAAAARTAAPRFDTLARKYGLHSPRNFLGVASTGQLGPDALRHLIEILPDGQTEIMMHPGIYDAELIATGSRLQQERQLELDALLDPEVKGEIVARQIRLITFRELK
ncbi:MAG: ChbG/HpnK family deacetylase, partial [Candidatus Acidiferrales bacterium]